MNKQIKTEINEEDEENFDFTNFDPDALLTNKTAPMFIPKFCYNIPPDEDFLSNNTLWPEMTKLYGHGYEIISISSSHDGKYIASGGKSQSEKNSKLFIWDATQGKLVNKLEGNTLTIVQIEFSPNDEYILTVSRDRSWCIFKKNDDISQPYSLIQCRKEAHGRIIWGCSWSHDNKIFATGSRDKFVKIWGNMENINQFSSIMEIELNESVTSVNFIPRVFKEIYVLIVGLESGDINLCSVNLKENKIENILHFHKFIVHGATVRRIKSIFDENENLIRIATASDDHSVRIFEIKCQSLKKLFELK
jgi:elongator complex protein 2